jgi:Fur family zinc uptake transcriptional regulator
VNLTLHAQERLQLAEKICKIKDARLTNKRRQVLTLLLLSDKAISAYDLIDLFKRHFKEELLPMTAYRNLDFLEEMQLAHRLNTANKYVACAHLGCNASHVLPHFLICLKCSRVDELNNNTTNNLSDLENKAEQTGYQLSSPQIELNGICNECLLEENKTKN